MADFGFDFEQQRLAAARRLPASCYDDFLRLSRRLVHGPEFQWLLVDAPNEGLRNQVMEELNKVLRAGKMSTNLLPLSDKMKDVATLEARLIKNAHVAAVIHVIGRPGWFNAARWDAFNVRRERLAAHVRARLVFWLDAEQIALASRGAPDLWAWRGGVYAFVPAAAPAPDGTGMAVALIGNAANALTGSAALTTSIALASAASAAPSGTGALSTQIALASNAQATPSGTGTLTAAGQGLQSSHVAPLTLRPDGADKRSMAERSRRVAQIRAWLVRKPAPPDELLVGAADELGRLLFDLGDYDAALEHLRQVELPLHRRLGDTRAEAITMGQIADILQARGQLDEALRIRKEEQLPVVERLGDVRAKAITMGKIADILQARGQLDQALRIRKEEELPVVERLGDVREKAITQWKIGLQLLDGGGAAKADAAPWLAAAYLSLAQMGLPEATLLAEQMRQRGLTPPGL